MLTRNKKSYAGIITAELGNILKKPTLDIKGLSIRKTTVPKELRKAFTSILENDILKSDEIDLKGIIDKYDELEESLEGSLKRGETKYLLPKNIEVIESYKIPDNIEAVRAVITWNALEPENVIVPPSKINIIKLNCTSPDDPRLEELKKQYPKKHDAIMKTVFSIGTTSNKLDFSRFGFSVVAIPKGEERIPEYLIPFIDFSDMSSSNMANGFIMLESLGIYTSVVRNTKYKSNIIEI